MNPARANPQICVSSATERPRPASLRTDGRRGASARGGYRTRTWIRAAAADPLERRGTTMLGCRGPDEAVGARGAQT